MPSGYARRRNSRKPKAIDLCNCGHIRAAHHVFLLPEHTYGCHKCPCSSFVKPTRKQNRPRIPFPST